MYLLLDKKYSLIHSATHYTVTFCGPSKNSCTQVCVGEFLGAFNGKNRPTPTGTLREDIFGFFPKAGSWR